MGRARRVLAPRRTLVDHHPVRGRAGAPRAGAGTTGRSVRGSPDAACGPRLLMRLLALETATSLGSVALLDDGVVVSEHSDHVPRQHLEWLAPAVAGVLAAAGWTPGDVEAVAVSTGPGAFTSLRIGIATAAMWARSRGIPAVGVPTLDVVARGTQTGGLIGAVLDVRRSEVALALFRRDMGDGWTDALLQRAFGWLMEGADFIALSRDRYWLKGRVLTMDCGGYVAALEHATGRTAALAGKPSRAFFGAALASLPGIPADRVVMVGDDLESDIAGAMAAGMRGWLVRTGKGGDPERAAPGDGPQRVLESVAELI